MVHVGYEVSLTKTSRCERKKGAGAELSSLPAVSGKLSSEQETTEDYEIVCLKVLQSVEIAERFSAKDAVLPASNGMNSVAKTLWQRLRQGHSGSWQAVGVGMNYAELMS